MPALDPVLEQRFQDLVKESKRAAREDREQAQLFQKLINLPEWKAYVALLDKIIQARGDMVLQPANGVDGCVALEYIKGALSGLVMARDLPSVTITAAKELPKPEGEDE